MQISATNFHNSNDITSIFASLQSGQTVPSFSPPLRTDRQWPRIRASSKLLMSLEAFVGNELSLVNEVECVFVERDKEHGKEYHVITVINARDPDIRAKVYAREQAVMDEYRGVDINFRVISRMNRNLPDVIDKTGRLAFKR